jgi:hypothetical protein
MTLHFDGSAPINGLFDGTFGIGSRSQFGS